MEKIRGSLIDGRVENVRYRQNQLHQLHASLRENAEKLCEAISAEPGMSQAAAETEFFLAMDSIDKAYQTLDFDQALKDEYSIIEGRDNLSRRVGVGLIAVRPGTHTRFYSIVTPLAMAIAAKNCIFLEIKTSDSAIDALLVQILPRALDRDLVAISSQFAESDIANADLFVDGTGYENGKLSRTFGGTTARCLAIVDRSANLNKTAREIVNSRTSPNNCSPYSPDLIIVNEFIKDEFVRLCLGHAAGSNSEKGKSMQGRDTIAKLKKSGRVKITQSSTSRLTIVEVIDRSCDLASSKICGPYVVILPSTSVTDTITSQLLSPENICTFIFANPSTAKFISEQISSAVSYINQIPPQLLIGPISSPHSLHPRYTTNMFSRSRPTIIAPVPGLLASVEALKERAVKPLKPTGQKMGHAVGFFEQGIFIGLGVTAFVILPVTAWFVWTSGKRVWGLWR